MDNSQIIELFQSRGLMDQSLAQDILAEVSHSGKEIAEILADFQIINHRDDIWPVIASELGAHVGRYPGLDARPRPCLDLVPAGTARLHGALPVQFDETGSPSLVDPLNPQTLEDLRFALGREIHMAIAPDYLVEAKINDCYGGEGKAMEDILAQFEIGGKSTNDQDLESEANSAPIIRYVDLVLYQAIKEKASDIHFEPFEKDFKIRYRVDGALYEMAPATGPSRPADHLTGQGDVQHEHRRTPRAPGRTDRQTSRRQTGGHAGFLAAHPPWRIDRAPRARPLVREPLARKPRTHGLTFTTTSPRRSRNLTESSSSPAPPVRAKPPRFTPRCAASTRSIRNC
jgi:hypothetical protein